MMIKKSLYVSAYRLFFIFLSGNDSVYSVSAA